MITDGWWYNDSLDNDNIEWCFDNDNNKSKMLSNQGEYHYLFKVVLVGNSCVGKSSIVVRYADD